MVRPSTNRPDRIGRAAKHGTLNEQHAVGFGCDRPLEPGIAGPTHLGAKPQETPRLERFDTPEVDDVVNAQVSRMATRSPHADTPHHAIDEVVAHQPIGCREAIEVALRRVGALDVSTRWTDAEL